MEALIGALYLDGGFEAAETFVLTFILSDLESKQLFYDSKTILQEKVQQAGKSIQYQLVGETGPDHDKEFSVEVVIDGISCGKGVGRNKKSAEQKAAYEALLEWEK